MEQPSAILSLTLARNLVLRHGWNATDYQILNPGMKLWFSKRKDAVVGYSDYGRVRVVAGAPICAEERFQSVLREFEQEASEVSGVSVCYFAAGGRLEKTVSHSLQYAKVLLGAQPVWHPKSWPRILMEHPSLRAQLYRARNKGVTVRTWPSGEAVKGHMGLNRCVREWLASRPMPAMHFLVEPQTLERLWDRRLFLAEQDGEVVGFLVVDPITSRRGFLVEQIVQAWAAPNGTAELLVDAAFAAAMKQGLEYFTLGLSPLSLAILEKNDQPFWLDFLFHWVRIHGSRFYNFQGLEHFKSKFAPDYWEPIHAISNQPSFTAGNLLAIAAVFGGGSPFKFLALALGRALRQEYQWFYNRIRGKKWEI